MSSILANLFLFLVNESVSVERPEENGSRENSLDGCLVHLPQTQLNDERSRQDQKVLGTRNLMCITLSI